MNGLKRCIFGLSLLSLASLSVQCKSNNKMDENKVSAATNQDISIEKSFYGVTPKGDSIDSYKLKNQTGMEVDIITFGGIITDLKVPNKEGKSENVVTGFNSIEQYYKPNPYFGALIGRFGNRIAKGKFTLDGKEYALKTNNFPNALHGGPEGFHRVVWKVEEAKGGSTATLKLSYLAKDMEEGYPGNLKVLVTYKLTASNALEITYEAETDKKTIINLTQHTYFNLSGDFSKTILDHEITINSDKLVAVDNVAIPTGQLEDVTNTPFDFRKPKLAGKDIDAEHVQIQRGKGYDHCWVLNNTEKGKTVVAAAYDATSGRVMEVTTDEPGVQFYSGNFLDGTLPTRTGGTYAKRSAFCFETQHYPDSPNQKDFPSTVLSPGEKYKTTTTYTFSVKK